MAFAVTDWLLGTADPVWIMPRMGRILFLAQIFCGVLILGGCGSTQLRQVALDDLRAHQVSFVKERTDGFLLRIDRYGVLSTDGQPRLESSEEVLLPLTAADRDPDLSAGEGVWIDGRVLRPLAKAPSVSIPVSRADKPAFKGMELYSYLVEDGSWAYAVLIGTNDIKFDDEIRSERNRLSSTDALKERIRTLPRGESLFWVNKAILGFPADLEQELIAFAQQQEVRLVRVDRQGRSKFQDFKIQVVSLPSMVAP